MPTAASAIRSASTAAWNTTNLPQKPNSGGMPARLNMIIAMHGGEHLAVLRQPGKIGDGLDLLALGVLEHQHRDEAAQRHRCIDREIDQHRRGACRRRAGQTDQHEADIVDRAIGHQPLDVGLSDRTQRADHDRCERGENHDLPPCVDLRTESIERDPHGERQRGHFGRGGEQGRHRGRRAFIDIGRPHVERHRADFEGKSGEHEHHAEQRAQCPSGRRARRRCRQSSWFR